MSNNYLPLDKSWLSFQQVKNLLQFDQQVSITQAANDDILKCREYLDKKIQNSEETFYGINTGFGFMQDIKIEGSRLRELQNNLLRSHACGMGDEVPKEIVKLMMMLKIKSLSYGHSGIGIEVVKRLMDMYNKDVIPVVFTQGSLGASGDLIPLSHLSLPLIGEGEVYHQNKKYLSAEILEKFDWHPIELQSKEGLALINGTQFMSAYGMINLIFAERLLQWADVIAAISFDVFDCVKDCLHEKIQEIRPHPGQVSTASIMRKILEGSHIASQKKSQVQDPYSFRCVPQVHGASKDTCEHVLNIMLREINAVTDNPNIFAEEDLILSGGNFHGQPLALGLDFLAIAISEIASISERRTFQLLSGQRGLPLFLVKEPGLHSGLMIPQYASASLVSENKQLCTPASVDSIPSSNNQEDHVSMGANAATKCLRVMKNVEQVLAVELLTAIQALEYKRPLRSSKVLEDIVKDFRQYVSFNEADRVLHPDIKKSVGFISTSPSKYGIDFNRSV